MESFPVDTGRKLNVYKTFGRRPGRLKNVLCTFNLRPVSTGLGEDHLSDQNFRMKCKICFHQKDLFPVSRTLSSSLQMRQKVQSAMELNSLTKS